MLYLGKNAIQKLVDRREVLNAVERAMGIYESGDYIQPDRITVGVTPERAYCYMPCFTPGTGGTKILSVFDDNPAKGYPTIQGMVMLNNSVHGGIECLLDGASVTANRTAAVGSTGLKYTSRPDIQSLGIVGTGVQGFNQAQYSPLVRPIKKIYVYDIDEQRAGDFAKRLEPNVPGVDVFVSKSSEDMLRHAEAVITTTTSAKPVLPDDADLLRGKHFIGVGSYKQTMREYPPSLYKLLKKIYVDVDFAAEESGDLSEPIREGMFRHEDVVTLWKGVRDGNIESDGTTFFKTVGMALFDMSVADALYQKALKEGAGIKIDD